MPEQPPSTNGVMTLTETDKAIIKTKLQSIQSAFAPTDETLVCDTFYLVSTYNKQNIGAEINGDTAEFLLS